MVAGTMRASGVFMGDNIDENNQESADFANRRIDLMAEQIEVNNGMHEVWGWKYPNAADYIDRLWGRLRRPHLICVFRDAVANGQGLNRWHPFGPLHAVQQVVLRQQLNLNLLARRPVPAIMISYEKALRSKARFLDEFSGLLGRSFDREEFDFEGFMEAGSYKSLSDFLRT